MAISETVSSVDTHELMPTDFYPLPSEGGAYDYVVYFSGAFIIIFVFIILFFPRKKNLFTHEK